MDKTEDNKSKGYIALFRSLQDHWIYPADREFTEYEAWIDLLMEANHKGRPVRVKNKVLKCKRGQSVRSLTKWAERWQWSKSKVYRFLELLESDGMIETVSETVTTRITICNYDIYQTPKEKSETQLEQTRNDPETTLKRFGTESDPNKNVNNANNEKKKEPGPRGKPECVEDVINFFIRNGSDEATARDFFDHYNAQGWKRRNRMSITSWQSAASKWIRENIHGSKEWINNSTKPTAKPYKEL